MSRLALSETGSDDYRARLWPACGLEPLFSLVLLNTSAGIVLKGKCTRAPWVMAGKCTRAP